MTTLEALVGALVVSQRNKDQCVEAILSSVIGAVKVHDEVSFLQAIAPWTLAHIAKMSGKSEQEVNDAFLDGRLEETCKELKPR